MDDMLLDDLAEGLARNRRRGLCAPLAIGRLATSEDALSVQTAALEAFDDDFVGYVIAGASEGVRRMLRLGAPIYAALPASTLLPDGASLRLPQGAIGAQGELAFTLGRGFPLAGEEPSLANALDAIVSCRPVIGILARRVPAGADAHLTAIADFGLHAATVVGAPVMHHDPRAAESWVMSIRIDGAEMPPAEGRSVMGHPVEAVAWLARELTARNQALNAGDVVTTGSWGPILQVLPGQTLSVSIAPLGSVTCRLS